MNKNRQVIENINIKNNINFTGATYLFENNKKFVSIKCIIT